MRTFVALVIAAAAIGVAAPSASARCGPDEPYLDCTIRCLEARLHGALC